eukprot:CAMPEP_0119147208 /NCGR_PEP_ID=MMETSP1310-20130426/40016_1 /TAXON_ID=464262 /ORGANISM="Genus nov. species nov., Strain RCC2339" /LENGTH=102 /DNA_ID=CAMNT_0007139157 /DNA_START=82 /DNA_END=386 /DNA_ORIENTATION=-
MPEDVDIIQGTKEEQYKGLLPQLRALMMEGNDFYIANLANFAAVLVEQFKHMWVGFYTVKENRLILGPFQGPVACLVIKKGAGVCGTAWERKETIVVKDVEA